jgi:hypothetical protein
MAFLRPELAFTQRVAPDRLAAIVQAAMSLTVPKFRVTVDPRAIEVERKIISKALPEPARAALSRVAHEYAKIATPQDLPHYLEASELSALRAGFFIAADFDAVKRMVSAESGPAYRVPTRTKIRDLMVFTLSEELHGLRAAVGTSVEVNVGRQ